MNPFQDGLRDAEIGRALKWDCDFVVLAKFWAELKSKDPSTKVGAVIVDGRRNVIGLGYNGFPVGVEDSAARLNDRPTKYAFVAHAELNAILNCTARPVGATLYCWPLFTCGECAKAIINAGIVRVVARKPIEARWQSSYDVALTMYREAGITVDFIELPTPNDLPLKDYMLPHSDLIEQQKTFLPLSEFNDGKTCRHPKEPSNSSSQAHIHWREEPSEKQARAQELETLSRAGARLMPSSAYIVDCVPALAAARIGDNPLPWWYRVAESRPPDQIIGVDYMLRWFLVPRNRLSNVYLHLFLRSDDDRALHDHPWDNFSYLLEGEYIEHTIEQGGIHGRKLIRAGDWKFRRAGRAHRVELINGQPTWSLFITGPKRRAWGFHCPSGWSHWKKFEALNGCGEQ